MPVLFQIDPIACLVSYSVAGSATPDEAGEFLNAALRHPHFERGFNFIGDRREVDADPDATYIQAAADELRTVAPLIAPCRWAVVVPSEAGFGIVEMWALLTDGCGVEIAPFTEMGRALEWTNQTRRA